MIFGNKHPSKEKFLRAFEGNWAACLVQDGSQPFKLLSRQPLRQGKPFHSGSQTDGPPQRSSKGVSLEPSALVAAAAGPPDLGCFCAWQVMMVCDSQRTWNNRRGSRRTCRRNRAGDYSQPRKDGMNSDKHRMHFRQAAAAATKWAGRAQHADGHTWAMQALAARSVIFTAFNSKEKHHKTQRGALKVVSHNKHWAIFVGCFLAQMITQQNKKVGCRWEMYDIKSNLSQKGIGYKKFWSIDHPGRVPDDCLTAQTHRISSKEDKNFFQVVQLKKSGFILNLVSSFFQINKVST